MGATAAVAGGLGLLGGLAGAQGNRNSQTSSVQLAPESELEKRGGQISLDQLNELQRLSGLGPGEQDVQAGLQSQRSLAEMLSGFAQGGFNPTQEQIQQQQGLAQQLFQGQQEGLNQSFEQQRQMASRSAARMGRSSIDPVLQGLLARDQSLQQGQLNANIGSFATQQAMNQPLQQLNFAQQLAQVQSGLATQAMSNRQAILGLGSQLRGQEQNFRSGTATRTVDQSGGGGFGGFMAGALGGVGAGLTAMNAFGGSGGKAAAPTGGVQTQAAGGLNTFAMDRF